ncbi:MAG: 3-isopropylmalate dehydratase small subunit [Cyanobacteria bacterium P01_E01_bin.45]
MASEIRSVVGRGLPLVGNDIDTDRIIPARFLRCVTFDGLGTQVFADDRRESNGQHSFDLPQYQGANVLVVNANFGCGSSREHAPQAIARWGIEAIIGESFAEIFFGNCLAMGVPCLTAAAAEIEQLQAAIAAEPSAELSVNVESLQVSGGDLTIAVQLKQGPQAMLTGGTWDTCRQLVSTLEATRQTAAQLPYIAW